MRGDILRSAREIRKWAWRFVIVFTLVIVGAGPRALSVLERVLALHPPGLDLEIELVDPAPPGPGSHTTGQPDYLLANTVAGQVTVFRHDDPRAAKGGVAGPSLAEWADCARDAYLPRRRLGDYFTFAFEHMRDQSPPGVVIRTRRSRAARLTRLTRGWRVYLDRDPPLSADFVILASGHGQNAETAQEHELAEFAESAARAGMPTAYVPRPYPLESLHAVRPGSRVAVRGMGLSAIDVVLALTVGRGGRFVSTGSGIEKYRPSGAEPRISLYSRYGRAFWPRARNQKSPADAYRPELMTVAHIQAMRERGKLDFRRDIVPLLVHEIRTASGRVGQGVDLGDIIDPLMSPVPPPRRPDELQRRLVAFYAVDEARSHAGNMTDPFKAGADAIRDLRNEIRTAVEFGGLSAPSHREFVEVYAPLLHVMSAGPPQERARQWRALFAAGILSFAASPATMHIDPERGRFVLRSGHQPPAAFDAVVNASVEPFLPDHDASPLVRSLLVDGYARPYLNDGYHPGGFDIDASGHLRTLSGHVHADLSAIGNPTEGPHYFTNMLPAPGLASRITADAEAVVRSVYRHAAARASLTARHGAVV